MDYPPVMCLEACHGLWTQRILGFPNENKNGESTHSLPALESINERRRDRVCIILISRVVVVCY